ncbi:hypothetical protein GGR52DRAFT_489954 [Hypoxylon sp. FL1284]|nr:hypothetical protein GGR52DRAFT_489954 [Hypoxylon sp. FL1284]
MSVNRSSRIFRRRRAARRRRVTRPSKNVRKHLTRRKQRRRSVKKASSTRPGLPNADTPENASAPEATGSNALVSTTGQREPALLQLPQEVFDMITDHLEQPYIVLLALLNKELRSRFLFVYERRFAPTLRYRISTMSAFMRFTSSPVMDRLRARGTLLSLVEYDMDDGIYCHACRKIHSAFKQFMESCELLPCNSGYAHVSRLTRGTLRLVTKRRMRGGDYRGILQQINVGFTRSIRGIVCQSSQRVRFRNDRLWVRQQHVVSSMDKSESTLYRLGTTLVDLSTVTLQGGVEAKPRAYMACCHAIWQEIYVSLMMQFLGCFPGVSGTIHNVHAPTCFSSAHRDLSQEEGHMICERLRWLSSGAKAKPMDTPAPLGDVIGCDQCMTDYSLDIVSLPEPYGWGFVLTS